MKAGRISRLEEARQYLRAHWKINYASVNGIWRLFRQRRVKFKTGRRRHRQADAVAQEAFQKTFAACFGNTPYSACWRWMRDALG